MPFGTGITCKPTLVQYGPEFLRELSNYTQNGTNDTTIMAQNTDYGSAIQTTVTNTDDQAGHVYLAQGPVTFVAGTKFRFAAIVSFSDATAEFGIGFSDGFATADTGIFSDTTATMTSQDSILAYQFSGSAFWRGEMRNAGTATASGATTIAATAALYYRIEVEGECQTNGLHARWWATDMSGAVSGRNNYYTIGYDSSVTPVTASGLTAMRFGWAVKTTTTTQVVSTVIPLALEYNTIAT